MPEPPQPFLETRLAGPVDAFSAWIGAISNPLVIPFPSFTGLNPAYTYTVPPTCVARIVGAFGNVSTDASAGNRAIQIELQLPGVGGGGILCACPSLTMQAAGTQFAYSWGLMSGYATNLGSGEIHTSLPDIWLPPTFTILLENDNFRHAGDAYTGWHFIIQQLPVWQAPWPDPYLVAHDREPN